MRKFLTEFFVKGAIIPRSSPTTVGHPLVGRLKISMGKFKLHIIYGHLITAFRVLHFWSIPQPVPFAKSRMYF